MVSKPLVYPAHGSALDEEILQGLKIPYLTEGAGLNSGPGEGSIEESLQALSGQVAQERTHVAGILLPTQWATTGARITAATSGMGSLLSCADLLATVESIPGLYGYYSLADAWAEAAAYLRTYGDARQRDALCAVDAVKVQVPREYAPGVIAGLVAMKARALDLAGTPLGAGIGYKVGIDHHHLEHSHWVVAPEGEGVGLYYEGEVLLSWIHIRVLSIAACARVAFSKPVDKEVIHTFVKERCT